MVNFADIPQSLSHQAFKCKILNYKNYKHFQFACAQFSPIDQLICALFLVFMWKCRANIKEYINRKGCQTQFGKGWWSDLSEIRCNHLSKINQEKRLQHGKILTKKD